MSIASEITLLQSTKANLRYAINGKGGSITTATPFAQYKDHVNNLRGTDVFELHIPSGKVVNDLTFSTFGSGTDDSSNMVLAVEGTISATGFGGTFNISGGSCELVDFSGASGYVSGGSCTISGGTSFLASGMDLGVSGGTCSIYTSSGENFNIALTLTGGMVLFLDNTKFQAGTSSFSGGSCTVKELCGGTVSLLGGQLNIVAIKYGKVLVSGESSCFVSSNGFLPDAALASTICEMTVSGGTVDMTFIYGGGTCVSARPSGRVNISNSEVGGGGYLKITGGTICHLSGGTQGAAIIVKAYVEVDAADSDCTVLLCDSSVAPGYMHVKHGNVNMDAMGGYFRCDIDLANILSLRPPFVAFTNAVSNAHMYVVDNVPAALSAAKLLWTCNRAFSYVYLVNPASCNAFFSTGWTTGVLPNAADLVSAKKYLVLLRNNVLNPVYVCDGAYLSTHYQSSEIYWSALGHSW